MQSYTLLLPQVVEIFSNGCVEVRFPDPIARGSVVYFRDQSVAVDAMHAATIMLNGHAGWPRIDMTDVSDAASLHAMLDHDDMDGLDYEPVDLDDEAAAELDFLLDSVDAAFSDALLAR